MEKSLFFGGRASCPFGLYCPPAAWRGDSNFSMTSCFSLSSSFLGFLLEQTFHWNEIVKEAVLFDFGGKDAIIDEDTANGF